MTDTPEEIHAKLAAALILMEGVGKDGWNPAQKFKFRGVDAIAAASKKVFEQLDIFVAPYMRFVPDVPQPLKANGDLNGHRVIIEATYRFYAPDGSYVEAQTIGEGVDSYDKATNKAMSAAFKYALMQVLCIGDPEDDGDASGEPTSTGAPAEASKTPTKARAATKNEVPADDWAAWEEVRPKLLDDDQLKETLVNWISGSAIKVDRSMSQADFSKLWEKAVSILKEAGKFEEAIGTAGGD